MKPSTLAMPAVAKRQVGSASGCAIGVMVTAAIVMASISRGAAAEN
jgi:hypothetical protein